MPERGQPSRSSESLPSRPANIREDSSKSTPSTTDPATDSSSAGQALRTPATPYTLVTQPPTPAYFKVPASPLPGSMSHASGEPSSKQAKVAIPRLKRLLESGDGAGKPGGRHRVTHACEPCRHRKTKCSGERPACRHCQDFKIHCYYADGKRDRVKKYSSSPLDAFQDHPADTARQFGTMQDKVAEYERILRDLSSRVNESDADLIRTTLERTAQLDIEDVATERSVTVPSFEQEAEAEESGAESEASGGAGSTGALDRTEEDFTRESAKATGFMGRNSDVTWLQRLRQENKYGDSSSADDPHTERLRAISGPSMKSHHPTGIPTNIALAEADQGFTVQDSSYHLNDLAISTYEAVDPYELPTPDHAQKLFLTYLHRVHPSFPIIGRVNLQNQFAKFISIPGMRAPPKWLAILNLIFAISAKYSHLVQSEWQADERDHLIFFTRARLLSIDGETLFQHPDLQMIQIFGLMSQYLLCIDQVNRAWTLAGVAIRLATALGLNMRNDSVDLPDDLKEIRYRVWWALYVLEHRLCTLTGRVNCVLDDHVTAPLPVPLPEEQFESEMGKTLLSQEHQAQQRAPSSNTHTPSITESTPSSRSGSKVDASRSPSASQQVQSGELEWAKDAPPSTALYFLFLVQISRLTQTTFHKLYSPTAIQGKWSDIQTQIGTLNQQLENWYHKLPAAFDFRRKQRDRDFYEARLALGFFYYSTKIIINRPCLCRLDRKLPGQSSKSREFNQNSAATCVTSAQELLQLIPDEPNAIGLLRVGPWSSILHLLVQSATVLMLEISFRAHHMPEQADDLLESSKKAIRWLHALGDDSLAGARAWKLCNQMLHDAATKVGRSVADMPALPPRAAGPVSDDTSMSGGTATQQSIHRQGQATGQGQSSNYPPSSMPMSSIGTDMSAFNASALFNPFPRFDQLQYYPQQTAIDPSQMQFTQDPNAMQYQHTTSEAEMNFMNQFTEQPQGSSGPPNRSNQGSGFS